MRRRCFWEGDAGAEADKLPVFGEELMASPVGTFPGQEIRPVSGPGGGKLPSLPLAGCRGAQCKGSGAVPPHTYLYLLLLFAYAESHGAPWGQSERSFPESENDFLVHAPFSAWDSEPQAFSGSKGYWGLVASGTEVQSSLNNQAPGDLLGVMAKWTLPGPWCGQGMGPSRGAQGPWEDQEVEAEHS